MIFQERLLECLESGKDLLAIDKGSEKITYQEVLKNANKITAYLLNKNVKAQTFVGVELTDRLSIIYAMIGVMNARCIFVPIDGKLPKGRLEEQIKELNLNYLITSPDAGQNREIANIFSVEEILEEDTPAVPNYPEFNEDDGLYVYYTSGSTGRPKGILGRNKSLRQFIDWEVEEFKLDTDLRASQFITPYFDAFLRDVFVPLFAGGTICIPPQTDDFFTSENMIKWIESSDITLIHCVPSVFRIFSDITILKKDSFEYLKNILLSGEKIIPGELKEWYELFDNRIQLVNMYGATETTMIRVFYKIKATDTSKNRIPIGKPIKGTELAVLNKELKQCKPLIAGDLYILSEYISKGYLGNEALNKEKFLELPLKDGNLSPAFKTGDKARLLPGGTIELLGREDRQVKIRGIRVELDEIENILAKSDHVKQAVVILEENDKRNAAEQRLLAFIVPEGNLRGDLQTALKIHMDEWLPSYMTPETILEINTFPLLSNGKIDYRALSEKAKAVTSKKIVAPVNTVEETLLDIWKEILGDQEISTDESFQKIGGNSLSIMRLIAKIYKVFNVRVPLGEIFKNLTVQSQAQFIMNAGKDKTLKIEKAAQKPAYEITAAQKRMYYNYQLNKNSTAYNISMAWNVNGDLNLEKVKQSLQKLVDRHEALRTSFITTGQEIMQVVNENVEVAFKVETSKEVTTEKLRQAFIRPFDLSEPSLFRAAVLTGSDAQTVFVVDIHHIVCDGISQMNLFRDFAKLYMGEPLPNLDIQLKDFAEWESVYRNSDDYIALREFWIKSFESDIPQLDMQAYEIEPDTDGSNNFYFEISNEVLKPLKEVFKQEQVTLFSGLFSICSMYLGDYFGEDDLTIGINSSGRIQEELENVVGMFAKTLPVRQQLSYQNTFKTFVKQTHEKLVKAQNNQLYDLSDLTTELSRKTGKQASDLFSVMFVFQNYQDKTVKMPDVSFSFKEEEETESKYPLTIFAIEEENGITFRMEFTSDCFNQETAFRFAEDFRSFLKNVGDNTDKKMIDYLEEPAEGQPEMDQSIDFNFQD